MQVTPAVKELEEVIERYHDALDVFVRGTPGPMKALFSHADDVVLANPYGPAVRGWQSASVKLEEAAAPFSDGMFSGSDRLATYASGDVATIYEVERGKVRVRGGPLTDWLLRTTTTFRREDGSWKVVQRHADPISTYDSAGPLRAT